MKDRKSIAILLTILFILSLVPATAQIRSIGSGASSGSEKDTGVTVFLMQTFEKGEVKEFNINKRALYVENIRFTPEKNVVGDMRIYIRRTYEFPTRDYPKLKNAHSYFEINTVNLRQDLFANATIEFLLEKRWLEINRLNRENVSLYRLTNWTWEELPTERIGEEEWYYKYDAKTPGFSYFGIARSGQGEERSGNETETADVNETEEPALEENLTYEPPMRPDINETEEDDSVFDIVTGETVEDTLVYWGIIILIMIAFYILQRFVREE